MIKKFHGFLFKSFINVTKITEDEMKNSANVWLFIILVILGMLIGNIFAELILLIPAKIITKIFSAGFPIYLHNTDFDIKVLQFNLGFTAHLNIGTVFGIFLGIFLYRWILK